MRPTRESQLQVGWTEELCHEIDQLAQQDHSHHANRRERESYNTMWVFRQQSEGQGTFPIPLRYDYLVVIAEFRRTKKLLYQAKYHTHKIFPQAQQQHRQRQSQFQQQQPHGQNWWSSPNWWQISLAQDGNLHVSDGGWRCRQGKRCTSHFPAPFGSRPQSEGGSTL